jgi:hypothetical protein
MSICGCTGSEPLPIDAPAPQIDFSVGTSGHFFDHRIAQPFPSGVNFGLAAIPSNGEICRSPLAS